MPEPTPNPTPPASTTPSEASRERLLRLLSGVLDAVSGEERDTKRAEVAALLETEPGLAADYAAFVATESLIEHTCGLTIFDDQGAGTGGAGDGRHLVAKAHDAEPLRPKGIASTAKPKTATRSAPSDRSLWAPLKWLSPQAAIAAALLMTASVGWTWLSRVPLATVTAANDVELANGLTLGVGDDLGEDWLELQRGSVRLALPHGVMASVAAPARFRVRAGNQAELESGAVSVHVPKAGHGFRLTNAAGRIVDLGTGFRAVADLELGLSVHVTQGAVRLESDLAPSRDLVAGRLSGVSADGSSLPDRFRSPKVSGQFRYVEEHPESLGLRAFVEDDAASVFLESYAVPLPYELRLDLATPGRYGDFTVGGQTLAAGTVIDCYLIHCAPKRMRHTVQGSVRFDGPVIGVLGNADRLNATNELLGAQWTLACQHPERGVESAPDPNSDTVTISRDRRQLSAQFRTMSIDQLRVLVARDAG